MHTGTSGAALGPLGRRVAHSRTARAGKSFEDEKDGVEARETQ